MNHKNTVTILLFLCVAQFIIAQRTLTVTEQQQFIAEVRAQASTTKTIVSDFVQTKHLGMLNNNLISTGNLAFQAPEQILWSYQTPTPYTVGFIGDLMYVTDNGKTETIALSRNKLFRSLNTLIAASIHGAMFNDEMFNISYRVYDTYYESTFIPKEKKLNRFVASFKLKFDRKSKEVTEVIINEPNGDYTHIVFKNRKTNVEIAPKVFTQKR